MNHLNQYLTEKFKLNSKKIKDNMIADAKNDEERYAGNWQWFNLLVTNVELEEDQYRKMFSNLNDKEIKVWIKLVQDCYAGTEQEDDAMKIGDDVDLARFYYQNPVTE